MGLSSGDGDHEMKEGVVIQLKDDSREDQNNMMIENVGIKGIDIEPCFDLEPEFDFWPIQHPTEPSHEDRPVQCPMPHSSHLISDDRMQDDRFSDRKRPEAKTTLHKENNELSAIKPPVRMVRKRHHDHTNAVISLLQMPSVYPHLNQKDG
ncbi:hypothetical protein HanRHA438_Chr17g0836501 [Helianthus annuus]|uniref:Uncharacterized protein n=1 Tax=Helianthus annuus TaxID=4232 RepID=A0A251RUA7_HELAN|nr:uncharacterized protein LOC110923110 isoform X2 [Helianthus annuus]KAF5757394.1 hypothetical protein HanXRQr2_Chr17g0826191 [Helianthus annuus]KAJ0449217.1 hypothetical protein HanHA89_Chr17g0725941 [Helianthus annuus]KAJ0828375.1 hypothetical protein HanRHA438_Chr17g0836501 [Helianthus annuus]